MKQFFEILQNCCLFDGISPEHFTGLLGCLEARVIKYTKKERMMAEGEPVGQIGIVLSGEAQIERVDYYGNRSIVTRILPCELFGETFACAGLKTMPVDVTAVEDCEIMLIDYHRITASCCNACEFHQRMIANLLKVVAMKNLFFHQKLQVTSQRTTREKLMAYLLLEAKGRGSDRFNISYDRQELADFLGVDRSGLSAEISKLRAEGVLECEKNRFRLL